MPRTAVDMTLTKARAVLGVSPFADGQEVRRAFREAAKRVHPDRDGGDAARFRDVIEAYRALQRAGSAIVPAEPRVEIPLVLSAIQAALGGEAEVALADGRTVRLMLPAGLREAERVSAEAITFRVVMDREGDSLVRGDDVWLTARLPRQTLATGGRIAVDTPLGKRIVWITRKAAERGLVRLEGQGLPARAGRPQGSLFLRLAAEEHVPESPARQLLRRFAAAWAA